MMKSKSMKSKSIAPSIFCLAFLSALYSLGWIDAFIVPSTHNAPSRNVENDFSTLASSSQNVRLLPQHQVLHQRSFATTDTRRMATVDKGSMAKDGQGKSMGKGKQMVLFQKVIRPTKDMPDVLFLGYLIEYLERHFELPTDLPMVYENMVVNQDGSGQSQDDRYTLAWDSPLSTSPDATRMEVEVVGIYTDDNKNKDSTDSSSQAPSVPNMAMVVVRRPNNTSDKPTKAIPPMMKGLFDDSEKRIIQALDRGLDDFVAGRIKFEMNENLAEERTKGDAPPPNVKSALEAIEAELVDDDISEKASSESRVAPEDVVFDAYATTDTGESEEKPTPSKEEKVTKSKEDIAQARARAMATMQKPGEGASKKKVSSAGVGFAVDAAGKRAQKQKNTVNKSSAKAKSESAASTVDFAVQAARKAAAMRKQKEKEESQSTEPKEDFAVAAARKMAKASGTKSKSKRTPTNKVRGAESKSKTRNASEPRVSEGPSMPPIPEGWKPKDYFQDQRVFSGTISTPKTFNQRQSRAKNKTKTAFKPPIKRASTVKAKKTVPSDDGKPNPKPVEPAAKEVVGKRKLNAKLIDEKDDDDSSVVDPILEQATSDESKMPSQKDVELEIMKATKTALDEIEDQGEEMTPEEMLKNVLKFDEEQKKEEKTGTGFVSGAFEKAKELMKDRHKQIQEREKQVEVGFREIEAQNPDSFPKQPEPLEPSGNKRELTPEEELRQMFAAGQKIAEGKITTKTAEDTGSSSLQQQKGTTEEDVDRLIAQEKTVSKYARILDDELAELEVRINASPGEELDGPQQNPIFDVMSGPEVYDPNVDMDAVNYPGALPGTADVKLPKQLDEAIKQAEFAAGVLMQMETKEVKDEVTGEASVKYFSGKKELTTQQVENLKTVVEGAVKSGIIDDPVEVMAEASRLQLVLDELWNQPEERFHEIASSYKDLLLSDRLVLLIRERLRIMADRDLDALRNDDESLKEPHEKERELLGKLVNYAQVLLKETRALGAELEAHQLEIIRSICKVAMDPEHQTEEETANALSDAVRDMRPLLDDAFVAYLKYAVAEEEAKLARAGLLDDPDYNQWLFVLKIVQQGVYAEIAKGINRYIDHIWYVLRMETPQQRRKLLSDLIDDMPTMDVRPFVQVVDNIVGALGDGVAGNFDGLVPLGEMTNTLLQLQNDVKELLPPERIAVMSKDADEWAAKQKKRLLKQRQIGEQRLEAAKEVAGRESDVDAVFGTSGEVDRFD